MAAQTVVERFWAKADKNGPVFKDLGPCWQWTAAVNKGYGVFCRVGTRTEAAHRVAFELVNGWVPEGDLDHLCRNTKCVNPQHLEPVTRRENLLRGETVTARNAAVTHCPAGHPYSPENTYYQVKRGTTGRKCRTCHRDQERQRRRKAA